MSNKCLILVLSASFEPYEQMIRTSKSTWDAVEVEGLETVYYCADFDKKDYDNVIYLRIGEDYFHMARKTLAAFEWALKNKEFDYICRPHSCIYVDKKELIKCVQELPEENYFGGLEVERPELFNYTWGGTGMMFSKDVIEKLVANKDRVSKTYMEDESLSLLASQIGIPFTMFNKSCSIDRNEKGEWVCISYCGKSKTLSNFSELKDLGHVTYRVKQDGQREVDAMIMNELFKVLK